MITVKSVGNFCARIIKGVATVAKDVVEEAPKIGAAINAAEGSKAEVEAVTSVIPKYGPLLVGAEDAAYAIAGEAASILVKVSPKALLDAGFDSAVVATLEDLVKKIPGFATSVKAI
jgi:hypothetical protein